MVQQYAERELINPEDRLRVIKGVATELEILWQDASVDGHWTSVTETCNRKKRSTYEGTLGHR